MPNAKNHEKLKQHMRMDELFHCINVDRKVLLLITIRQVFTMRYLFMNKINIIDMTV